MKSPEKSIDSLIAAVKASIDANLLREILWNGINQHFNQTNNFTNFSKLYQQLSKKQLSVTSTFTSMINYPDS